MTPSPGDTLITLRTVGPLRRGDVVTVSHTSPSGEYVYLDETSGKIATRADAFMIAVKRPWHAWADPEWERRAREAAERFVREGIAVEATAAQTGAPRARRCGDKLAKELRGWRDTYVSDDEEDPEGWLALDGWAKSSDARDRALSPQGDGGTER